MLVIILLLFVILGLFMLLSVLHYFNLDLEYPLLTSFSLGLAFPDVSVTPEIKIDMDIDTITGIIAAIIALGVCTRWYLWSKYPLTERFLRLVVVTKLVGRDTIYYGIIDLNDPQGFNLNALYADNNRVTKQFIFFQDEIYVGYYMAEPGNIEEFRSYNDDLDPLNNNPTNAVAFPAPNRNTWLALGCIADLRLYTGWGNSWYHVWPNPSNVEWISLLIVPSIYMNPTRLNNFLD